jgi:hypothetical protein
MYNMLTKKEMWDQKMKEIETRYNSLTFNHIPQDAPNTMVIVEPRKHLHLQAVLKNMIHHFPDWNLHIFHGTTNKTFLLNILGSPHQATLTNIRVANLTKHQYSRLLTTPSFWKSIKGNKILIFQTDVLVRHNNIQPYLQYDYIGGPWCIHPSEITKKLTEPCGGNGGFSLRSKEKCIQICETYPYNREPEDLYFSKYMQEAQNHLPFPAIARDFCVDQVISENPLALHQIYNLHYLPANTMKQLLDF